MLAESARMSASTTYLCADLAQTERLGAALAAKAKKGDCFCLSGDLGSGKSALARAFIRARAGDQALDVPSPTFPIILPYDFLHPPIYHIDCYRLDSVRELDEIGFEDALSSGICLIEWPEIARQIIGRHAIPIAVSIAGDGHTRHIEISGFPLDEINVPTRGDNSARI